jgi:hypothetical protein
VAVGNILKLRIQGYVLTLSKNGVDILTVDDSASPNKIGSGKPGLYVIGGTVLRGDDFQGGGL